MTRDTASGNADGILERLLTLATSDKPLPCNCLRSIQSHLVKKHDVDGPALAFPLLGYFLYNENAEWHEVHAGGGLVVPNARSFDIAYIPDATANEFNAMSVGLTDQQLEATRLLLAEPPENFTERYGTEPPDLGIAHDPALVRPPVRLKMKAGL